jgi:hypothetical protein
MELTQYILNHTIRGECKCGRCDPFGDSDPSGHTVDMVFFKVAPVNNPTVGEFRSLTNTGAFAEANPFDGAEHSYIELGAWIGDQGLALQYMGLGVALGAFTLLSPAMLGIDGPLAIEMAGKGLLSIQCA